MSDEYGLLTTVPNLKEKKVKIDDGSFFVMKKDPSPASMLKLKPKSFAAQRINK